MYMKINQISYRPSPHLRPQVNKMVGLLP